MSRRSFQIQLCATVLALQLAGPALAAGNELQMARLEALPVPTMDGGPYGPPGRVAESVRAYAIDGASFYLDGRRIQVDGLPAGSGRRDDLARQRLQALLDSGEIRFDGRTDPASGALLARVWIDGREMAELMR